MSIYNKVKEYCKDIKYKEQVDFRDAYETYLKASLISYSKVKTLIYRHEPKNLYSFYECVGVKCGEKEIDTKNIHNILDIGNKLIITGTGGIGKTTMLKHFFINTIKETRLIPILVELRKLNDEDLKEISILNTIYDSLQNFGFKLEQKYFEYSMEVGCYLILFDGYDELKQEYTEKITKEISDLSCKFPQNYYLLSSRPSEEFVGWNDFIEMNALPLNKEQALSLIKKLEFDEKIKNVFYKELENKLFDKYKSFASNPLLLTIMLLTFDNRASIPDKLNDFYEQAFATLYNIHDASKGAYKRDIRCGLGYEDFKLVFSYVCFKSYFNDEYSFTEKSIREYIEDAKNKFKPDIIFNVDDFKEDLIQSVCMLVKEGLNYRFSHRSFQEYFAAFYTTKLSDKEQEMLIVRWLKQLSFFDDYSYLYMLYNLQKDRFNRNIIYPILLEIQEKTQYNHNSVYKEVYGSVRLRTRKNRHYGHNSERETECNNQEHEIYNSISFEIKNLFLHRIIDFICNTGGFKNEYTNNNKAINILSNETEGEKMYGRRKEDIEKTISFEEIEEKGLINQVIECAPYISKRIDFCKETFRKLDNNMATKLDGSFKDILNQL
nr:NACHT domain-containing protein [Clostridium sp. Cult3]